MPTTHTVAQGETLTRIAKQYGLGSWQKIYNHPDNAEFRALRDNPDLIYPGDKIVIPDLEQKPRFIQTNKPTVFRIPIEKEYFRLKLQNKRGEPLAGTTVEINLGGKSHELTSDSQGLIELELEDGESCEGSLKVFNDKSDKGQCVEFDIEVGSLAPVEELAGVQARCNALGYNCGVADGIMGSKTRSGVKAFQAAHGLDVDGVPGPKTKAKLKEVYGS